MIASGWTMLASSTWTGTTGLVVLGVAHCLLGYSLFRILLGIDGLLVGGLIGMFLVAEYRQGASATDFVVAIALGAMLGLLASWLIPRIVFALGAGAAGGWVVAYGLFGPDVSTTGWVMGVLAAVVLAVFSYATYRKMVVYVTAISGAGLAALKLAPLAFPSGEHLYDWFVISPFLAGAVLVGTGLLATSGIYVQKLSPFFLSDRYSPVPRKGSRTARATPRFTRI